LTELNWRRKKSRRKKEDPGRRHGQKNYRRMHDEVPFASKKENPERGRKEEEPGIDRLHRRRRKGEKVTQNSATDLTVRRHVDWIGSPDERKKILAEDMDKKLQTHARLQGYTVLWTTARPNSRSRGKPYWNEEGRRDKTTESTTQEYREDAQENSLVREKLKKNAEVWWQRRRSKGTKEKRDSKKR
jgi:hypothetical protein